MPTPVLDQFQLKGGKIGLTIYPNGIKTADDKLVFSFSLMIGLKPGEAEEPLIIHRPIDLIEDINTKLSESAAGIDLVIRGTNTSINFSGTKFFSAAHIRRWRRLFRNTDFTYQVRKRTEPPTNDAAQYQPFYEENAVESVTKKFSAWNPVLEFAEKSNFSFDYNKMKSFLKERSQRFESIIVNRERKYDLINFQGKKKSELLKNRRPSNIKDLIKLIYSLYQYPRICLYYGLLHHFDVPADSEFGRQYSQNNQSLLDLKIAAQLDYFEHYDSLLSEFESFVIQTSGKYYHGRKNYALISKDELKATFTSINLDSKIQNEKVVTESYISSYDKGIFRINPEEVKQPVTEGIYMLEIQRSDEDRWYEPKPSTGVIGQNIAVIVGQEVLSSLCYRKTIFEITDGPDVTHYEEGWIQMNGSMQIPAGASYKTQNIFHWHGQNLAVPPKGFVKKDMVIKEDAAKGGIDKIFEGNEEDVIKSDGFKVEHKLVRGTNVPLVTGKSYNFLLRNVLSNGYIMPVYINEKNLFELTLQDLQQNSSLANYLFTFQEDGHNFLVDQDPLNPPYIVNPDSQPEQKPNNILVKSDEPQTRLFFPPAIEFRFAQFLGLTTKERLGASSLLSYKARAKKVAKRSLEKMEKFSADGRVEYLADTRGVTIVVTPADWRTYNAIRQSRIPVNRYFHKVFEFSTPPYEKLKAKKIVFNSIEEGIEMLNADDFKKPFQINVGRGLELRFYIQLVQDGYTPFSIEKVLPLKMTTNDKNKYQQFFANFFSKFSITSDLKHPKGEFFVSHIVQKPDPFAIVVSTPVRPLIEEGKSKSFYNLGLKDIDSRFIQEGQVEAAFSWVFDDGRSVPPKDMRQREREQWERKNKNWFLLDNEYPYSIFTQEARQTEPEVYLNGFGVQFQFNNSLIGNIKERAEVFSFNFGSSAYLRLVRNDSFQLQLVFPDKTQLVPVEDPSALNQVCFDYYLDPNKFNPDGQKNLNYQKLTLRLTMNGSIKAQTTDPTLPYKNLSDKYLTLQSQVELQLIEEQSLATCFAFLPTTEYFCYRSEANAKYLKKKVFLRALSRFHQYFPEKSKAALQTDSNTVEIEMLNNEQPAKPVFTVTPLLAREKSTLNHDVQQLDYSMPLMLEIERPLANNELLAIILSEVTSTDASGIKTSKLTANTCAIGRDLTTFVNQGTDFGFPYTTSDGKAIGIDISMDKMSPYLAKYFTSDLPDVIPGPDGKQYAALLLQPFFDIQKQKWIVCLGFTESFQKWGYNPFVKIVLAKYQPSSMEGKSTSDLTQPKYISFHNHRIIQIIEGREEVRIKEQGRESTRMLNILNVSIKNKDIIKYHSAQIPMSYFVVVVREKSVSGISGRILASSIVRSGEVDRKDDKNFHVMDVSEDTVKIVKRRGTIICLYEFESFYNTRPVQQVGDWLDDPDVRLLYAEEFD